MVPTCCMRPRATMATSGRLTSGAEYVPPMLPMLDTVSVPPEMSSDRSRPFTASACVLEAGSDAMSGGIARLWDSQSLFVWVVGGGGVEPVHSQETVGMEILRARHTWLPLSQPWQQQPPASARLQPVCLSVCDVRAPAAWTARR
jgi:hypothetical protein